MKEDGSLYYKYRVCVTNDSELKKAILEEAHSGSFAMHPGSDSCHSRCTGINNIYNLKLLLP